MNKQKAIVIILAFLSFLLFSFFSETLAQTRTPPPPVRRSEPSQVQPRRVIKRGEVFQLVNPSNTPIAVTFNECVNAAKSSCTNGVSHVDHEESTGNCNFGCLAAPSKPKE
jgi:threonine/homoserine/homoserine lactone efflux protein